MYTQSYFIDLSEDAVTLDLGNVTNYDVINENSLGNSAVTTRSNDIKIMLLTISSVGIPANIFCGIVILATPWMRRKPFNVFLLHQAFVDFMVCSSTCFLQLFDDINSVPSGKSADVFCRVWVATSLMWMTIITSTFNLTAMTLERYKAVTLPL